MKITNWEIKKREKMGDKAFLEKCTKFTPHKNNVNIGLIFASAILSLVVAIVWIISYVLNKQNYVLVVIIMWLSIFLLNLVNSIVLFKKRSKYCETYTRYTAELDELNNNNSDEETAQDKI